MTEKEARKKWCPFARVADGEPAVAVNRPEPYGDVPKCLGTFCMMWRWRVTRQQASGGAPEDGFCGLMK